MKKKAGKKATVVLRQPSIILDRNFVANYLREQNKPASDDLDQNISIVSFPDPDQDDLAQNVSIVSLLDSDQDDLAPNVPIISLSDSDTDDENKSVRFVSETIATHEMKKIADLSKKLSLSEHQNRKLQLHVEVLQKRVLKERNENANNELNDVGAAVAAPDDVLANNEAEISFDNSFNLGDLGVDQGFVGDQLEVFMETGQMQSIAQEFQNFLMNQNN